MHEVASVGVSKAANIFYFLERTSSTTSLFCSDETKLWWNMTLCRSFFPLVIVKPTVHGNNARPSRGFPRPPLPPPPTPSLSIAISLQNYIAQTWSENYKYRIFSIKRRTPNKRWVQINAGSTAPSLKFKRPRRLFGVPAFYSGLCVVTAY